MDAFPDQSEIILNRPEVKMQMLEAEKKLVYFKWLEMKKPTSTKYLSDAC